MEVNCMSLKKSQSSILKSPKKQFFENDVQKKS